jgi:mitotic-spindle organizing protein 1
MDPVKTSIDLLYEMSLLLNTGLDKETLCLSVSLLESGVNPEALQAVIKELQNQP